MTRPHSAHIYRTAMVADLAGLAVLINYCRRLVVRSPLAFDLFSPFLEKIKIAC